MSGKIAFLIKDALLNVTVSRIYANTASQAIRAYTGRKPESNPAGLPIGIKSGVYVIAVPEVK